MEDPKSFFGAKDKLKYLDETEAKYGVKKSIPAAISRQYIDREVRLVPNMNKIYGIILVKFTPGLQSVLKVNEYFPSK